MLRVRGQTNKCSSQSVSQTNICCNAGARYLKSFFFDVKIPKDSPKALNILKYHRLWCLHRQVGWFVLVHSSYFLTESPY